MEYMLETHNELIDPRFNSANPEAQFRFFVGLECARYFGGMILLTEFGQAPQRALQIGGAGIQTRVNPLKIMQGHDLWRLWLWLGLGLGRLVDWLNRLALFPKLGQLRNGGRVIRLDQRVPLFFGNGSDAQSGFALPFGQPSVFCYGFSGWELQDGTVLKFVGTLPLPCLNFLQQLPASLNGPRLNPAAVLHHLLVLRLLEIARQCLGLVGPVSAFVNSGAFSQSLFGALINGWQAGVSKTYRQPIRIKRNQINERHLGFLS